MERHALGVAAHRDALLDAGQHLKRGLLLYGPPGTGKTHTTRYLVGQMTGYTRLTLTGRALGAIGAVTDLARDLQPSVVVLEDVDLVAEERSMGPGSSPVLFDLLDAMDGAAADADLLFVLTTNRADLLEPALAARPGGSTSRSRSICPMPMPAGGCSTLYGRSLPLTLSAGETSDVVERTEGVTASFLKELLRRAMLEGLSDRWLPADGNRCARCPRARRSARHQPTSHAKPAGRGQRSGEPARRRRTRLASASTTEPRVDDRSGPDATLGYVAEGIQKTCTAGGGARG